MWNPNLHGMGISYPTDQLMPGDTTLYPSMNPATHAQAVAEYNATGVWNGSGPAPNSPEYYDAQAAYRMRQYMIFGGIAAGALLLVLFLRRS